MTSHTLKTVSVGGARLDRYFHICAFFDSRELEYSVLSSYYKEGIDDGEKAIHIVDSRLRDDHRARLIRLVDDMRDVAHIGRGTISLQRSELELASIVEQAIEACAALLQQRRHTLALDVPQSGLLIYADPFRLQQVLVNLLVNAARYTKEGGRIELGASRQGDKVQVSVRDNGVGISPELMTRIFDPFVQARGARDTHFGGLGIGLSLVRSLVELHGGTVNARSGGPGLGSQFTVTLPCLPEGEERRAQVPCSELAGSGGRGGITSDPYRRRQCRCG